MRIFLLALSAMTVFSCADRSVYKSSDFSQKSARHQTVAILPLRIVQTGHVSKRETPEDIRINNERLGYTFQENLNTFVLRQTGRNRKGTVVNFQSVQKTNGILKQQGMDIDDIYDQKPEDLARLLQVDAVLMTTLERSKNVSDGVAYGIAAGQAILGRVAKRPTGINGPNASDISMNCSLYDSRDSKLLWKTFRTGGTDIPAFVDDQIQFFSNWIARKLPYRS